MLNEYHLPLGGCALSNRIYHIKRDAFSKELTTTLLECINPITNIKEMQYIITQSLFLILGYSNYNNHILQSPLYRRLLYAAKITATSFDKIMRPTSLHQPHV